MNHNSRAFSLIVSESMQCDPLLAKASKLPCWNESRNVGRRDEKKSPGPFFFRMDPLDFCYDVAEAMHRIRVGGGYDVYVTDDASSEIENDLVLSGSECNYLRLIEHRALLDVAWEIPLLLFVAMTGRSTCVTPSASAVEAFDTLSSCAPACVACHERVFFAADALEANPRCFACHEEFEDGAEQDPA